jgi:hypothetical protein
MNEPAGRGPDRGGDDRDDGHLFWYWVPVVGAGVCLVFLLLDWWSGV